MASNLASIAPSWLLDPGLERCLAAAGLAAAVALVLAFSESNALRRPVAVLAASAFLSVACLSAGPSVTAEVSVAEAFSEGINAGDIQCVKDDIQGQPTCTTERVETKDSIDADERCRYLTDAIGVTGSFTVSGIPFLDNGRIKSYMNDETKTQTCYIIPTDNVLGVSLDGCTANNLGLTDLVDNVVINPETFKCDITFQSDVPEDQNEKEDYAQKFLDILNTKASGKDNLSVSIS